VEYKEHVADHVRAWEGEELREIYHSSSKINSQKKEENKTSDWSLLGRVWTRKSQKGNKGFFLLLKRGGIERKIRGEGGKKFVWWFQAFHLLFLWIKR
jgi:hypothetical protein